MHTRDETANFISRLYKVVSNLVNRESARCPYKAIDLRVPRQMTILQSVPLATEPGISLIILPLMWILQRNLKRTYLIV
jgi:hypothetical protein